jgi:hypothetical protein
LKRWRITEVAPLAHGIVRVTFSDGVTGDYDLRAILSSGPMFRDLADADFFQTVAVGAHGRSFGWRLDQIGHEIDFCADTARAQIETDAVIAMAEQYRTQRLTAAE